MSKPKYISVTLVVEIQDQGFTSHKTYISFSSWIESQWKFYHVNIGTKLKKSYIFMAGKTLVLNFNY